MNTTVTPVGARRWVRFEGRTYRIGEGASALDAMCAGGAEIEFSCRRGVCRCCLLQAVSGDPGDAARAGLPETMRAEGCFLACLTTDPDAVEARRPDRSKFLTRAMLAERTEIGPQVFRLLLETETVLDWRAGQSIAVHHPDGAVRNYSVVSRPQDYFVEIHVRRRPGGAVSDWLASGLAEFDELSFSGPSGACHWLDDEAEAPLLLIGTGVAAGALFGIARDALEGGHGGPVALCLGARTAADALFGDEIETLAAAYPQLSVVRTTSREGERQRVTDAAFADCGDLLRHRVYLMGAPGMVETARIAAVAAGARPERIHADPFAPHEPYSPQDAEKIDRLPSEPELWAALGEGAGLTAILTEFYARVFTDPKLAPYFQRATRQRLVEQQYSFLRDLMTGRRDYFGERPFNAHHWMLISDALFDHREALFFDVVREAGIAEPLARRWRALHEVFRREIVKQTVRGQWFDGVEIDRSGFELLPAPIAMLCDGCGGEVTEGAPIRSHRRTGQVFCAGCVERACFEEASV